MTHRINHRRRSTLGRLLLTLLTPLLEKNVLKKLAVDVPVVLSMSRCIALAFAVALLRQIWRAGIAGWPDATLSIAIVLALPLLGALDRLAPRRRARHSPDAAQPLRRRRRPASGTYL